VHHQHLQELLQEHVIAKDKLYLNVEVEQPPQ
jgi:hypothetical protein